MMVPLFDPSTGASGGRGRPPVLVAAASPSPVQLSTGTTSTSVSFNPATGGAGLITHTLSVASDTGLVTLSGIASDGLSCTVEGLTDSATCRVLCTATDQAGQQVTASAVFGVGVAPVYAETALWNPLEEIDFQTLGTGTRSGTGSLVVGGVTFTVISPAGPATGINLTVNSSGAKLSQGSGIGTSSACYVTLPIGVGNFAAMEGILVDLVFSCDSVPTSGIWTCGFGDGTYYGQNDFFGFQGGSASSTDTGSLFARRYQSSTATNQSLAGSQTLSGTYSGQVLLGCQRIAMSSLSRSSDYLGGPRLGIATLMRGTWSGSQGGAGVGAAATVASALSSMKISWGPISGATGVTLKKARISRLTRPPSI